MHLHQKNKWHVSDSEGNGIPLAQHIDMLATQGNEMSPFSDVVISQVLTYVVNSLNNSAVEVVR